MLKRTPLYDIHAAAGAKLVDFGGWDMPLHYGSQIEEHHAVRRARSVAVALLRQRVPQPQVRARVEDRRHQRQARRGCLA